jgi:hypothetical protein
LSLERVGLDPAPVERHAVLLRRVLPDGAELTPDELAAELGPAERAPATRPFVFLNMVTTLDGRAAFEGSSKALGGPADLAMLLALRTVADAVLIGAGTLRAEGYGRLVRADERRAQRRAAERSEDPTAVIVSRGLDVPWGASLFQAPEQPVLVYTRSRGHAPSVPAPVEVVRLDDLPPYLRICGRGSATGPACSPARACRSASPTPTAR